MHGDSGQIPLTRDGGYKLIQAELAIFEEKRIVPAINALTAAIAEKDGKTDDMRESFNQLRGAIKGLGVFNAVLGVIWIGVQIYRAVQPK